MFTIIITEIVHVASIIFVYNILQSIFTSAYKKLYSNYVYNSNTIAAISLTYDTEDTQEPTNNETPNDQTL